MGACAEGGTRRAAIAGRLCLSPFVAALPLSAGRLRALRERRRCSRAVLLFPPNRPFPVPPAGLLPLPADGNVSGIRGRALLPGPSSVLSRRYEVEKQRNKQSRELDVSAKVPADIPVPDDAAEVTTPSGRRSTFIVWFGFCLALVLLVAFNMR